LETKSEKMRVLAKAGYARADIARYLDVRYQFVRNVLLREEEKVPRAEMAATNRASPNKVKLETDGRVRIPSHVIAALNLRAGETLIVSVDGEEIRLMTIPVAVQKAQALVRRYVPEGVSLVDELLEDRRRETDE
jgi:bifunctional DNA-binding transcriptional regulator/antitoxin component of YhaV-PrlF toxin-antitoxin module